MMETRTRKGRKSEGRTMTNINRRGEGDRRNPHENRGRMERKKKKTRQKLHD
jgi:hypothetical protein